MDQAKKLIDLAKEGGADAAKFQSYKADTLASKNSPSYWDTTKESTESQHELFQKYDQFEPDDYVVATGESHTIREFLDEAFYAMNYDGDWEDLVVVDPEFYRPAEVDYLLGDSTKVKETLRWIPEYAFEDLVAEMVEEDL